MTQFHMLWITSNLVDMGQMLKTTLNRLDTKERIWNYHVLPTHNYQVRLPPWMKAYEEALLDYITSHPDVW